VTQPADFATLVDGPARAGWIGLHGGDLIAASEHLEGAERARALTRLALLHEDLDRLSDLSVSRTYTLWETRSGLPEGSAIPVVAALQAYDSDDAEAGAAWLAKGGAYGDPDVMALAASLSKGFGPTGSESGPGACVDAHLAARAAGDFEPLERCGTPGLVSEEGASGPRILRDPLVFQTHALVYRAQIEKLTGQPSSPLARIIFSSSWSAADADAQASADPSGRTMGPGGPTLDALGLVRALPPEDDGEVEWARQRVRDLDEALDGWQKPAADAASPDGASLLADLDLVGVYRSQVLVAWTREALLADRPHVALATAQLALDASSARRVGPRNTPELFALLAEANLRTGRTREALDSLQPLQSAFPLVHGLDETIGDLVILEGLGRLGDSKEN